MGVAVAVVGVEAKFKHCRMTAIAAKESFTLIIERPEPTLFSPDARKIRTMTFQERKMGQDFHPNPLIYNGAPGEIRTPDRLVRRCHR